MIPAKPTHQNVNLCSLVESAAAVAVFYQRFVVPKKAFLDCKARSNGVGMMEFQGKYLVEWIVNL